MTSDHPDANQLAAFAEGKLLRQERQEILAHLADCAGCREIVALASAPEEPLVTTSAQAPARLWWRLASAVAATALVLAATWGLRIAIRSPQETIPQTTASLKKSVAAPLPAPAPAVPEVAPVPKPSRAVRRKLPVPKRVLRPALPRAVPSAAAPADLEAQRSTSNAQRSTSEAAAKSSLQILAGSRLAFRQTSAALTNSPPAWRVGSGALEYSPDGGKSWQPTPVNGDVKFQAVQADGADVWASGSNGSLWHSADSGAHWSRIEVQDANGHLAGSIVSIRLPRHPEIVLETDSGEQWISIDNGFSWRRL